MLCDLATSIRWCWNEIGLHFVFLYILCFNSLVNGFSACCRQSQSTHSSKITHLVLNITGMLSLCLLSEAYYRVLTSLENLEISGNFVNLENSGKTQGI